MDPIRVFPLGAGRDVGRSCILVYIGGKTIMLDCGIHMGMHDERKLPDFRFICGQDTMDKYIDCVLVTHFHLDHCAALPYLTEKIGYNGPIYMSMPTKAICPILLDDFRKICEDKLSDYEIYTKDMIDKCMKKVKTIKLHEVIKLDDSLSIKAYYAGHVLGAVMFYIQVGDQSVVYTGDFNMTSDSHLGSAWINRCQPNVLISESTYATTIREARKCREIDFLRKVHETVEKGGKVLIPVFALGRAQELCILLDQFWKRTNLDVPIYVSPGMAEKSLQYYKLFISWTNEYIKNTYFQHNSFDFRSVEIFDKSYIDRPGPMVVLASPGMLHAGLSLHIFKRWASDPKNTVILPGYCVANTVGNKVLNGHKRIELDHAGKQVIEVNLQVCNMSFSAHADAVGILQLIDYCRPKNAVILVHGEATVMDSMHNHIKNQFNIECYCPANGQMLSIATNCNDIPIKVPSKLLTHAVRAGCKKIEGILSIVNDDIVLSKSHNTHSNDTNNQCCPVVINTTIYLCYDHLSTIYQKSNNKMNDLSISNVEKFKTIIGRFINNTTTYIYKKYCKNGLFPISDVYNKISYSSVNIEVTPLNESQLIKDISVHVKWSISDNLIASDIVNYIKSLSANNIVCT